MLKRTKGRFLLAMLVVTGLAGTLNNSSLSKQERKFAVNHLKDSRSNVLQSTGDLTEEQLNFRPEADKWSIKECVIHITLSESTLWDMLNAHMKTPATPEKRADIKFTDEQLMEAITSRDKKVTTQEILNPRKSAWKNTAEALAVFKEKRNNHIKYVKSTTEDLRNHVLTLPFGSIDGYQFILFVSSHTNRHIAQIREIRAHPSFPK